MKKEKTDQAGQGSFYPDKTTLRNQALTYLARFAATESQVKTFLERKIQRRLQQQDQGSLYSSENRPLMAETTRLISDLTTDLKRLGLLNDEALAKQKAASLQRTGASAAFIRHYLAQKGIGAELIRTTLSESPDENKPGITAEKKLSLAEQEFYAALISAKKRRIGPFRREEREISSPEEIFKRNRQEQAILARKGFSAEIALRALSLPSEEAEEFIFRFRQNASESI